MNAPKAAHVVSRVAAAVLGTYAVGWGFIALGITLGTRIMPFGDARTLAHLLTFLLLLVCFCWAFTARGLVRVWMLLLGSGGFMTSVAWLLTRGWT